MGVMAFARGWGVIRRGWSDNQRKDPRGEIIPTLSDIGINNHRHPTVSPLCFGSERQLNEDHQLNATVFFSLKPYSYVSISILNVIYLIHIISSYLEMKECFLQEALVYK